MEIQDNENGEGEEFRNQKLFEIRRSGKERKINFFLVVEALRLIYYAWFLFIIVLGVIMTVAFTEVDYKNIVKSFGGAINVCVYLDFPPVVYVLPTLYSVCLIIVFLFVMASIFRAWISKEEGKILDRELSLYSFAFCYFLLSTILLSVTFSIQPDLAKPKTWTVHTLPFTNIIFALMLLHIAMTWFNTKIAWEELKYKRWLVITNYISLIILIGTSLIKIAHHINSFGGLEQEISTEVTANGWLWDVKNEPMRSVCGTADKIWMIFALILPMFQSAYLVWQKYDTHGLIITIEDNRKAGRMMSQESSRKFKNSNVVPESWGL